MSAPAVVWSSAGDVAKADEALQKGVDQVTRASQVIQRLRQFVEEGRWPAWRRRCPPGSRGGSGARAARRRGTRGAPGDGVCSRHAARVHRQGADPAGAAQSDPQCRRGDAVEPRRELTIRTSVSADRMVEVSVTDSGPGLAADVREKLFQPFVTTKPAGMGVGLSICRGIIEAHGGRMWLADARRRRGFPFHVAASPAWTWRSRSRWSRRGARLTLRSLARTRRA